MITFSTGLMNNYNMSENLSLDEDLESNFYRMQADNYYNFYSQPSEEYNDHHPNVIQPNNGLPNQPEIRSRNQPQSPEQNQITNQNNEIDNVTEGDNLIDLANPENNNQVLNVTNINALPNTSNGNNSLGRKRKDDLGERVHSKYKEDNIMRKIKTSSFKYISDRVNSSLSKNHRKFLKINPKVNKNLNIDYNINLMHKPLKNIFAENEINGRYSKSEYGKNYNANLVQEIYNKKEETKAIQILDLTYIDLLDIIRKKHLKEFREMIKTKEMKNGENEKSAEKYVNQLVDLLFRYENWFLSKAPRGPRSKKNE